MNESPLKIKDIRVYKNTYFSPCILKKNAFKELAPRTVRNTGGIYAYILVVCNCVHVFFPEFHKISPWMAAIKCQRKLIRSLIVQLISW